MSDDVVSRLLEAIEQRERFAYDCLQRHWVSTDNYLEDLDESPVARFNMKAEARHAGVNDPQAVLLMCMAHRDLVAMFPVSAPHLDTEGGFYGFQSRDCGEHRTVGAHRAWCFDCSEWCYPQEPCRRCHGVSEVLRILARGYGVEDR